MPSGCLVLTYLSSAIWGTHPLIPFKTPTPTPWLRTVLAVSLNEGGGRLAFLKACMESDGIGLPLLHARQLLLTPHPSFSSLYT